MVVSDLAYTIASQKDYPSWGYMISQGATTIWELWNGDTADPAMNSGNHVMLVGDFVIWLFEDLAGICPDMEKPGFKHIVMRPQPVGDLTFVKASHLSPYGLIQEPLGERRRKLHLADFRAAKYNGHGLRSREIVPTMSTKGPSRPPKQMAWNSSAWNRTTPSLPLAAANIDLKASRDHSLIS